MTVLDRVHEHMLNSDRTFWTVRDFLGIASVWSTRDALHTLAYHRQIARVSPQVYARLDASGSLACGGIDKLAAAVRAEMPGWIGNRPTTVTWNGETRRVRRTRTGPYPDAARMVIVRSHRRGIAVDQVSL